MHITQNSLLAQQQTCGGGLENWGGTLLLDGVAGNANTQVGTPNHEQIALS
jgi:hypothetical protein